MTKKQTQRTNYESRESEQDLKIKRYMAQKLIGFIYDYQQRTNRVKETQKD